MNYKYTLQKLKWELEEVAKLNFTEIMSCPNFSKFQEISINTFMNKGSKFLSMQCSDNYDTLILLNDDLSLAKNINDNTYPIRNSIKIFQSFLSYVTDKDKDNLKDSIIFHPLHNLNKTILLCSFNQYNTENLNKINDIENITIKNFIYDNHLNLLYVLSSDLKLFIVSLTIIDRNNFHHLNSCNIIKQINLFELDDYNKHFNRYKEQTELDVDIQIFRKDLIIIISNRIYAMDLNDVEVFLTTINDSMNHTHAQIVKIKNKLVEFEENIKQLNKKVINSESRDNRFNYKFAFGKLSNGNKILVQTDFHHINQYDLLYPNSKLYAGKEEILNFNFKIPIIFIALIILFFYHVLKNKKKNKDRSEAKKEDILEEIKNLENENKNETDSKKSEDESELGEDHYNNYNYPNENTMTEENDESEEDFDEEKIKALLRQKKDN